MPASRDAIKTPTGARSAPPIALTQRPRTQPPETILRLLGPRYSQSLKCGLAILACFTPESPVWGIADLADEVGLPRSTTHRYASTLTELGHLQRTNRRKYRLCWGAMSLGLMEMGRMDLAELQAIHAESVVTAEDEDAPGVYSIAAPIHSATSEVCAALGMDVDSSTISLKDLVDALGPHLVSAADRVSARLGYRREDERLVLGFGAPQVVGAASESSVAAQDGAASLPVSGDRDPGGRP